MLQRSRRSTHGDQRNRPKLTSSSGDAGRELDSELDAHLDELFLDSRDETGGVHQVNEAVVDLTLAIPVVLQVSSEGGSLGNDVLRLHALAQDALDDLEGNLPEVEMEGMDRDELVDHVRTKRNEVLGTSEVVELLTKLPNRCMSKALVSLIDVATREANATVPAVHHDRHAVILDLRLHGNLIVGLVDWCHGRDDGEGSLTLGDRGVSELNLTNWHGVSLFLLGFWVWVFNSTRTIRASTTFVLGGQ